MKHIKHVSFLIGLGSIVVFSYISIRAFDAVRLEHSFFNILRTPAWLFIITGFYLLSFLCRALAWKVYTNGNITFSSAVAALFYSLFFNHLLPIKAGDIVRIGIVRLRNPSITVSEAVHSVAVMRIIDTATLMALAGSGMYIFKGYIRFVPFSGFLAGGAVMFCIFAAVTLYPNIKPVLHKQVYLLKERVRTKRFPFVLFLIVLSWVSEGIVVFGFARTLGHSLSFLESVWVNSLTVGGQVFQVTPGGIATYETIMSASLVMLQIPLADSYNVALFSHAYKFIFSFVTGLIAFLIVPITMRQITSLIRRKGAKSV